jgi:uncharacterized membrane protein (UPF0136 family)
MRMAYVIGIVLALSVSLLAFTMRFDRNRVFYPMLLIVIASYYVLFAVIGGSPRAIAVDSAIMLAFVIVALVGSRKSLWLVAVALAAHGVLDLVHGRVVENPGVPAWWPAFCLAYDVAAAAFLAWLLTRHDHVPSATH